MNMDELLRRQQELTKEYIETDDALDRVHIVDAVNELDEKVEAYRDAVKEYGVDSQKAQDLLVEINELVGVMSETHAHQNRLFYHRQVTGIQLAAVGREIRDANR